MFLIGGELLGEVALNSGWRNLITGFTFLASTLSVAQEVIPYVSQHTPMLSQGSPSQSLINIGTLTAWIRNDGYSPQQVEGQWDGSFPSYASIGSIGSDGMIWGGIVNDGVAPTVRVGGTTRASSLGPGRILTDATGMPTGREDPNGPDVRIFRVRGDWRTADLREDATQYYQARPVTQSMIGAVREQYRKDWNEWPWQKGAPFVDLNGNGAFDPDIDIAGVRGADQTIWFVTNDLDPAAAGLFGSPSIGLEIQFTLWSMNRTQGFGSTIFKRTRLIYKGRPGAPASSRIDNMYIAQWSDPNVGDFFDDYVGCDTIGNMTFAYQGLYDDRMYEAYALPPPCIGYVLLQGPIVRGSSSDRAIFKDNIRPGFRNLPMSSFMYFGAGRQTGGYNAVEIRPYPEYWQYAGTTKWYNILRGSQPSPPYPTFTPLRNQDGAMTKFELAGDPAAGVGDIDGRLFWAGERSFVMSTGPFSMARGDTQEVVTALVGAIGSNWRDCFPRMRIHAQAARVLHQSLYQTPPPIVTVTSSNPGSLTTLRVTADARNLSVASMTASARKYDQASVGSAQLFDDGLHGDNAAGDRIFSNTISFAQQKEGVFVSLLVTYSNGSNITWDNVADNFPGAGPITVTATTIVSDNINGDKVANPGENVRYTVSLRNSASIALENIMMTSLSDKVPKNIVIARMNANAAATMQYSAWKDSTFFSIDVPPGFPDSVFIVPFLIRTKDRGEWKTTLRIPVRPFPQQPSALTLGHTGPGDWSLGALTVNSQQLILNHQYRITILDSIDAQRNKGFTLRDLTDGRVLLQNFPFPDYYGHWIPVTDGFRIMRGQYFGNIGVRKDSTRYISAYPAWFEGYHYTLDEHAAFNGGVTTGAMLPLYFYHVYSSFDPAKSVPVEVRFDSTKPQKAYRLQRTGPGDSTGNAYMIQGAPSVTDVPFTVWDVSDRARPRQLTVAYRDQDENTKWDPRVGTDNYEMVFIYYKSYDATMRQFAMPPAAIPDECTIGPKADIMYQLGLAIKQGHRLSEKPGTLYIRPWIPLTSKDQFTFTATGTPTAIEEPGTLPRDVTLAQNMPNPFNPTTLIQYELPAQSEVELKVFDLLGEEVATLVNEKQEVGKYRVAFDGVNLPTGVYFYRLKAGQIMRVKKMLMVR